MREGDICISAESFLLQKSSYENIQALEDTVVYSISYEELQDIYREFPSFNFVGRTLAEKFFLQLNQQLYAMRMQPAQARYSWMLEKFPGLILRVPLKYIASYLGMTDVMLSKIRSRKCA
jgi:CRP-like cAMP-binding protein